MVIKFIGVTKKKKKKGKVHKVWGKRDESEGHVQLFHIPRETKYLEKIIYIINSKN